MTNSPRWPILQWTERLPPDENCLYDHCVAYTPFGQFLITWKSWKTDWPTVDETPWGDYECTSSSLEKAKAACQQAMNDRLEQWVCAPSPPTGPNRQAEQLLEPTLTEKIAKDVSDHMNAAFDKLLPPCLKPMSDIAAALPMPSPDPAQPAEEPEQPPTKGAPASSGAHPAVLDTLYEYVISDENGSPVWIGSAYKYDKALSEGQAYFKRHSVDECHTLSISRVEILYTEQVKQ
jgi:hypothetical protein